MVQGKHKVAQQTYSGHWDWCSEHFTCPLCGRPETLGRAGLLWVGERFYATPEEFIAEGKALGFSKRIKAVPKGFKVGETYVLLAHRKAVRQTLLNGTVIPEEALQGTFGLNDATVRFMPGIFYLWLPQRIEQIFAESDRGSDKVSEAEKRGIIPVFVPSDDPDHQGSVYDSNQQTLFTEDL